MKKHFLPLLLCCTLLTGCAAAGADTKQVREIPGDVDIPQLVSAETAEGGYAAFAAELLRQTRSEGENTLVSPLSVALALGMTANGAAGDTLAEFQDLFGMDLDTLNAYCARALHDYSALGGSTKSTVVNSLWCDPDLTLEDGFAARCQQNYGAELYQADLQDRATVQSVNEKGTEAAAVTAVVMEASAAMPTDLIELRFDRPFVCGIVDTESGAPLFLGTVEALG